MICVKAGAAVRVMLAWQDRTDPPTGDSMGRFFIPEAFSVPYAGIGDAQRDLVRLLNALDACALGDGDPAAAIDCFLAGLHAHFANDHRAMHEAAFPRTDQHLTLHRQCLAQVEATLGRARAAGRIERTAVTEVFTALIDVIARGDIYFREYLVAIGRLPD